jgi:hypothetical protein
MKSKLEETFDQLKTEVLANSMRWVEPTFTPLNDNPEGYSWTGNGPQGKQTARFAMWYDDKNDCVCSYSSTDKMIGQDESNHIGNYRLYLRLNNWL